MRSVSLAPVLAMAAVALLVVPACGGNRPVSLREGPREYVGADYDHILTRWTRSERLYSFQGVDDVLAATATFESWDFRWAYVIRYAEDFRLTIEQRRELLAGSLTDAKEHHQFYVALYGRAWNEADLTREKPAWIVRLVDDKGHTTAPEQILHIKKPGVLERSYFPYTTVWRQVFRLRFPAQAAGTPTIAPDAGLVGLRFSGPLGNLELHWMTAR
ncbi:MAG: hypothetical protein ACXWUG_04665 [Polyangiales bacterium]